MADGSAVAAFALTEPEAGSDPAALSLSAEADGDAYRLTGEKLWISNAPDADIYTVFARTAGGEIGRGARGLTAFAVPGDAPGLGGARREMLAPHAIGSLTFDGVWVSAEQMLGAPGEGFRVAMRTLDLFRPSVGAFAVGMARRRWNWPPTMRCTATPSASAWPSTRRSATGWPICVPETEAARLLVHQAAPAHDAGVPDPSLAAMAKLLATEVAQAAVDAAVQFHGAVALEHGHPLEHLYRDVRATRIYEGASEIQREIISRAMFRAAAR